MKVKQPLTPLAPPLRTAQQVRSHAPPPLTTPLTTPVTTPLGPVALQPHLGAKSPLPKARLEELWSTTGSADAWARLLDDAGASHAFAAGALSLHEVHRHGARALFGKDATRPTTYIAVKEALEARGMFAEWRALMDAIPAGTRDALLEGTLTPQKLFDAWAVERSSWRWGVQPMSLEQVRHGLALEGRLVELERAVSVMTPGQKARLEAGVMKPRELNDVLVDAKSRQADVVIIGAGMAGLAAAQELMAQGLSVVVLEAAPRLGGRLQDAQAGDAAGRFDAGAAWIHATDENPLTPIIKQRGFDLVAHDAPLQGFGGQGTPDEQGLAIGEAITAVQGKLEEAAHAGKDVAASEVLTSRAPWMVHANNTVGPLTMGVDLSQTSTLDAGSAPAEEHGAGSDATPDQFIKQGWNAVVTSFSHGVPIRLASPVSDIKWGDAVSGGGVQVQAGGVSYRAKKIVMTASTAVLAGDKIKWDPPLPDWKKDAAKQLPMATFDKIALRFDDSFAKVVEKKGTQPGAFVYELDDENPMDVLVRPMNKDMVVALIGGTYADKLQAKGKAAMVEELLGKLERIYGPEVREHLVASEVTSWKSDPWQGGSFTAAKPGYARAREKLKQPLNDTLFFAGEGASARWNGMVPGAYLTGLEAAEGAAGAIASGVARAKAKAAKLRPATTAPPPRLEASHP